MHTRCCDFFFLFLSSVYCIVHSYSPFPFCSVLFVFVVCSFPFICLRISVEDRLLQTERAFLHKKEGEGKWEQRLVHRGGFDIQTKGLCCI